MIMEDSSVIISEKRQRLNETLREHGLDDSIILDGFKYWDDAIIGVSTDGNLVYSYKAMVDGYVKEMFENDGVEFNPLVDVSELSEDEMKKYEDLMDRYEQYQNDAIDFISYNTLRAIPYMYQCGKVPIIMDDLCSVMFELDT